MKKFFFVSALALVFASCSTDGDSDLSLLQEDAVVVTTVDVSMQKMYESNSTPNCINSLSGSVIVDVSGGLNNPQVVFIADVPSGGGKAGSSRPYTVTLQVETLTDCEDINSGSGTIIAYSLGTVWMPSTLKDPNIKLFPSQLPSSCYRWRFTVEGTTAASVPCISTTPWDFEPLF